MILPLRRMYWLIPILGLLVGGGLSLSGLTAPWLAKAEMACGLDSVDIEIVGVERSYNGLPIEAAAVVGNHGFVPTMTWGEGGGRVIKVYRNEEHRIASRSINSEQRSVNTDCPFPPGRLYIPHVWNLAIRSDTVGEYIVRCRVKRSEYPWDVRHSRATIEQRLDIPSREFPEQMVVDTHRVLKIILSPNQNERIIAVRQKQFEYFEYPNYNNNPLALNSEANCILTAVRFDHQWWAD